MSRVSYIDKYYIEISLYNKTAHLQVPLVPKLNWINNYEECLLSTTIIFYYCLLSRMIIFYYETCMQALCTIIQDIIMI